MSFAPLVVTAAEAARAGSTPTSSVAVSSLLLVTLVVGLLAFGAGRDHS